MVMCISRLQVSDRIRNAVGQIDRKMFFLIL